MLCTMSHAGRIHRIKDMHLLWEKCFVLVLVYMIWQTELTTETPKIPKHYTTMEQNLLPIRNPAKQRIYMKGTGGTLLADQEHINSA